MISELQSKLSTKVLGRNAFSFSSLDSTSTYIRKARHILPDGTTVIADEQLAGRGRTGKSFYSPKGDGLYFSFLLKDEKYLTDPLFTVKMSYAVCRAIDKLTKTQSVRIKWVNDIYIGEKKLAGILCESAADGTSRSIIVGVGVNFSINRVELPSELRGKAGSLRDVVKPKLSKATLCAYILNEVEEMYDTPHSDDEFLALYRQRSAVLGREITVLSDGKEIRAAALDIATDGGLIVRYENGITDKLTAGEISIAINRNRKES